MSSSLEFVLSQSFIWGHRMDLNLAEISMETKKSYFWTLTQPLLEFGSYSGYILYKELLINLFL